MAATYQTRKKHDKRPGDERWQKDTTHMNPTDNEDEKTKGKQREIRG